MGSKKYGLRVKRSKKNIEDLATADCWAIVKEYA